ncbi:MAG: NAD(P)H-binding protein [Sandaracinaceae bacterium]
MPSTTKLAVFGANGPVGLHLTQQALDQGHEVTAVTRRAASFPIAPTDRLTMLQGDVRSRDDVLEVVAIGTSR